MPQINDLHEKVARVCARVGRVLPAQNRGPNGAVNHASKMPDHGSPCYTYLARVSVLPSPRPLAIDAARRK
jgi:hypothetical protein